eukprot:NODE_4309_length_808_cov_56.964758_g4151_i0.p1 GENE.NODE_4309_length_808_cov_56.964758_g4151_i0~~NODE_4309_length_808_cov_56.964758_g4151_i0.p1  ORF type:complete len:261 (+),score=49.41 NODE_4309_length_808_cov_56.964758_g4151_i0:89-784(+)
MDEPDVPLERVDGWYRTLTLRRLATIIEAPHLAEACRCPDCQATSNPVCGVLRMRIDRCSEHTISVEGVELLREADGYSYLFTEDLRMQTIPLQIVVDGHATTEILELKGFNYAGPETRLALGRHTLVISFVPCNVPCRRVLRATRQPPLSGAEKSERLENLCILCTKKQSEVVLPCTHCILCRTCAELVKQRFGRCPQCNAFFVLYETIPLPPNKAIKRGQRIPNIPFLS